MAGRITQQYPNEDAGGGEMVMPMNEFVTEGLRTTKMALPRVGLRIADAHDLTRLLGGMLYGVKPWDLVVLGSVSLLLLFVALMASYFPARRATAIDPTIALRYQ